MSSSLKNIVKDSIIKVVNSTGISSKYAGTPKSDATTEKWVAGNEKRKGVFFKEISFSKKINIDKPPLSLEDHIHSIYTNEYEHTQLQAFVACIPDGRVWGRCGTVITPDDILLSDVSREFGKAKGVMGKEHSVFKQLKLHKLINIKGRVAILACAGSNTYYHWLYDCLSRVDILRSTGVYDSIDYFIIDYSKMKFQKDSLAVVGIPEDKIICCNDNWKFHIQADELIVPSLPARLGIISNLSVQFLRKTFLKNFISTGKKKYNLYLSRAKAPTRKLINESELIEQLEKLNFISFFPEEHSIKETAEIFAQAENIIGVHGSAFSNLAFCSPGTNVIDILAPKHLDALYWIACNYTQSNYAYLFGKGERLPEGTDLVKNKIDDDIEIDVDELLQLYHKMNN